MSVMDVRRLVRALGVGGLGFLFFGGAVGFVSAGDGAAKETWLVPAPGPGDRASYDVEERILDRGQADRSRSLPESRFDVEWMPATEVLAPDLTPRQAHVLGTTFRYVRSDHETRNEVAFDAATGIPLSRAYEWSGGFEHDVSIGVANQEAEGRYEGRRERLEGPLATCGLRADLQGRPVAVGDAVVVFGGCEDDPDSRATPFTVRGWDTVDGERHLLLESPSGLRLHYDPALPVPVRVEAHMLEQMDPSFAAGRRFILELKAYHAGGSAYEPITAGPLGEAPRASLAPLTRWTLEDAGVAHPFPVSRAHAAAMDPANYGDSGEETVPEFMARHPDAYLAYAWGVYLEDGRGTPYHAYAMLWTDGEDAIAKAVMQYPTALYAAVPVPGAPTWPVVQAWETDLVDRASDLFPSPAALPRALPSAASLWPLAAQAMAATDRPEPNTYSFLVTCSADPCLEASAVVYAGATLYPANGLDIALQDQEGHTALLGVDRDGHVSQVFFSDSKTEAPLPVLPAESAPPAPVTAAGTTRIVAAGWTLPAPEAVAGVGFVAVLMGALYYLWPTLKGGLLGLFSRIEPDRVLDHPARRNLHALVEANPGIHFGELVRRTGFGRGQLEHHLRKLERAELVSRVKGGSYACFFARGRVDRRVMAAAPLLRSDGGRSILSALRQRPGASSRDLAAQLGLAVGTVSYHVKRLREAGMLESAGGALHLTETGRQATALAA